MNDQFHTASFVTKFMGSAIAHCRLNGPGGGGFVASLSNDHCVIELENVDNDYVRFEFHRPGEKEPRWELADYLDCRFAAQGGAFKLRPEPSEDLSNQEKFEWYLQRFDEVLVLGYLDAPLSGDYSWEGQYREAQEEYKRLSVELSRLSDAGLDPEGSIWRKRRKGDLTWMDEVRGLLEQNSLNSQDSQD